MRIEQAELRDALRALLNGLPAGAGADVSMNAITEAGWLALCAPHSVEGMEQPLSTTAGLYIELGAALSPAPVMVTMAALDALHALPPTEARDDLSRRLIAGEPVAASLVSGKSSKVAKGVLGSGQLLLALEDRSILALIPSTEIAAISRPLWDKTRQLSEVTLPGEIRDEWILAEGAAADRAMSAFWTHLHFALAGDCVGAAQAILADTVAYLKTRRQFDRPLAMFQALKHRCADLKTRVEASEALLTDYLLEAESGSGRDPLALAQGAKGFASSTFRVVAEEALQLHGGIGMTEEHSCHLYLKRALLNEQLGTPDEACELAVATALLESAPTRTLAVAR